MKELIAKLNASSDKCHKHAATCRDCFYPIIDDEGNPQYISEACIEGARLLTDYRKLEADYFRQTER